MLEVSVEVPKSITEASGSTTNEALMTVAAFMLSAGVRILKLASPEQLLQDEELDLLGLRDWWNADSSTNVQPDFAEIKKEIWPGDKFEGDRFDGSTFPGDRETYYKMLGDVVTDAIKIGSPLGTLRAVVMGTQSPDDLVRICSLISATQLFKISPQYLLNRLRWFVSRELNPTAKILADMLMFRWFGPPDHFTRITPSIEPRARTTSGLMLIHGTNLWTRPDWSIPVSGPLFNYVQKVRPDLYGSDDYFRWEGGYTNYAREVASQNLSDWVGRRCLNGIDAITHSHGGNVLMASTKSGASFSKVIFLSCPIHWSRYQPAPLSIEKIVSIRVKFDLVILADRGSHRFPKASGASEEILPIWFVGHNSTYEPDTWRKYSLDRVLI